MYDEGSKNVEKYSNNNSSEHVFYTMAHRAERISSGLHLISTCIPQSAPLRNDICRYALRVVKKIYMAMSYEPRDQVYILREIQHHQEYLLSLIRIAKNMGYISEMNATIADTALDNFLKQITHHIHVLSHYDYRHHDNMATPAIDREVLLGILNEASTATSSLPPSVSKKIKEIISQKTTLQTTKRQESKGHDKRHFPITTSSIENVVMNPSKERRDKIYDIIATKQSVTIKDIATRITGCSEKTLQRDLLAMINDNIIEKQGDKRWSTYHIKDKKTSHE